MESDKVFTLSMQLSESLRLITGSFGYSRHKFPDNNTVMTCPALNAKKIYFFVHQA